MIKIHKIIDDGGIMRRFHKSRFTIVFIILSMLAVAIASCNGSSSGSGGIFPDTPTSPVTIGASGGSIQSADGKARIVIPAGALSEDTEISLELLDLSSDVQGEGSARVYQALPAGLTFSTPAVFEASASDIAEDGTLPSLLTASGSSDDGFIDGQEYEIDYDSNVGVVRGSISHFTTFSVLTSTFEVKIDNVPFAANANESFGPIKPSVRIKTSTGFSSVSTASFRDSSSSPVTINTTNPVNLLQGLSTPSLVFTSDTATQDVPYFCNGSGLGTFSGTISMVGSSTYTSYVTREETVFALSPALFMATETYTVSQTSTQDFTRFFKGRRVINCAGSGIIEEPTPTPSPSPTEDPTPEPSEEPSPTPSEEPTPEPTVAAFASLKVDDEFLSFKHVVGSTGCPQTIGSVTVTNDGTAATEVTVKSSSKALSADASSFILGPGESKKVTIIFTCSQATSFEETIQFVGSGNDGASADVTVSGDVG